MLCIVATLPPRQQEVLQLKFQNDLSYQEISETTQLSVSHVGVLLPAALKTLRARHAEAARDFIPPALCPMKINLDGPKLTAYALDGAEKQEMEIAVTGSLEARELVQEIRALGGNLRAEYERELSVASRVADRRPVLKEDKP